MFRLRSGSPWLVFATLLGLTVASATGEESRPLRQIIDAEVQTAWKRDNLTPSSRADDAALLRRIYLDLVGTIPTADEALAFLQDSDAKKREKLIDQLLDDPRHALHQANVWDQVFFGRHPAGGDATRKRDAFKTWLAERFAKNDPYDQWVRDLLLAEQPGTEMFYVQYRNQPEEATVGVSRFFLGTQLQCARCHDHPYEPWTQKDFYGMAGFFVRLVVVEGAAGANGQRGYKIGEKSSGDVLFAGAAKDLKPGQKGEPVKPKFLGSDPLDEPTLPANFKEPELKGNAAPPKPLFSRKEKLAEWIVRADNPYFARAAANRIWAQFMGRGLVHPVDDLSDKNQPSHPALLDALTRELVAHKFDLKWFYRELANSETYQLGAAGSTTTAMPRSYERARVRPLSAEEMLAAIRTATGDSTAKLDGSTNEYFLRYFGEPTNGQGEFQGSLGEHLFLNNSSNVRQMIQPKKGNLADALLTSKDSPEQKVDRLFLAVLSRMPNPTERTRFAQHLTTSGAKPDTLVEEAIWALLNTAEFRFNH